MKSKAQSILEYVVIFAIAVGAVGAMATYFNRAIGAKLQEVQEELAPPSRAQAR